MAEIMSSETTNEHPLCDLQTQDPRLVELARLNERIESGRRELHHMRDSISRLDITEPSLIDIQQRLDEHALHLDAIKSAFEEFSTVDDVEESCQFGSPGERPVRDDHSHLLSIKQELSTSGETRANLQPRITASLKHLDELYGQHRILAISIPRYHKRRVTSQQVPEDIWRIIFRLYVHGVHYDIIHQGAEEGFRYPALTLSHVCQRWRAMALDQTEIWPYSCSRPNAPLILRTLRERGGSHQRSVFMYYTGPNSRYIQRQFAIIAQGDIKLGPVYDFWCTIWIDCVPASLLPNTPTFSRVQLLNMLPHLHGACPLYQLPELVIKVPALKRTDLRPYLLPHLTTLMVLSGPSDVFEVEIGTVDMSNLRHLALTVSHVGLMQAILASGLETLTLIAPSDAMEMPRDEEIWLESLSHLISPCTKLILTGWPETEAKSEKIADSSSRTCLALAQNHTKGLDATFRCTHVEGLELVKVICKDVADGTEGCRKPEVKSITFDRCTGIRQIDCDALSKLFKVSVYL